MYIPLFKGSNTPFQSAWPYCTEKFQGGIFLVYIIRSYPCVMSTGVVFALVVWKIFHPGLSIIQKHLLFIFFTCPEILHFHCTQSLLFNGVICDANGGCVVTMYQYWWYCMVKIFEGCLKNHPFLEIQKNAPSSASAADTTTYLKIEINVGHMHGYKLSTCSNMMCQNGCLTPYLMLEIVLPRPGVMLSNRGPGMLVLRYVLFLLLLTGNQTSHL